MSQKTAGNLYLFYPEEGSRRFLRRIGIFRPQFMSHCNPPTVNNKPVRFIFTTFVVGNVNFIYIYIYTHTGTAVPLQAWRGSKDSRKLGFPDFVTMAQDGGKVVSLTHRPPCPRKYSWYSFVLEAESTSGP